MRQEKGPKISFGIIVLNGEPFTRYCLRALYPFAHEIIVVEGASNKAADVSTPDGHSTDGTLEVLNKFKAEEDPENKIQIITRDGFWAEKDEQSQAYAERATGDYLWQVDIDEFYKPEDMLAILNVLKEQPEITAGSFKMISFWGGFDYVADGFYLRRGANIFHRLFKFGKGYKYVTHRPPTVTDPGGKCLRNLNWLTADELEQKGIHLYHYSLIFPKQVREKSSYYQRHDWDCCQGMTEWAEKTFMNLKKPYHVHNVHTELSWLERFNGTHPPAIQQLMSDIRNKKLDIQLRRTDDIDELVNSRKYQIGRFFLKMLVPLNIYWHNLLKLKAMLKK